jgi:hypothetical protein
MQNSTDDLPSLPPLFLPLAKLDFLSKIIRGKKKIAENIFYIWKRKYEN